MIMPRLAIIIITPIQLALVAWYFAYWDKFPKYSLRRIIPWAIFTMSGIGIPLFQIFIYKNISGAKKVDDTWVGVIILLQSGTSIAMMYYILLKRRRNEKNKKP